MIKFRTPINDVDNTVVGPVVVTIMNDIKRLFFLNKDVHITFRNDEIPYINENWNIGNQTQIEKNQNRLTSIEVDYELNTDELNTTDYKFNGAEPIIFDIDTGLNITALYVQHKISLDILISSKSKNKVSTLISTLLVRKIVNRSTTAHDLIYYHHLPKFALALINNVLYNKNKTLGENVDINDFLQTLIDDRFTLLSPMSGDLTKTVFGFKECQCEMLGYFTDDIGSNKRTYNKDTQMWEAKLKYELYFKIPMFYEFRYQPYAWQYKLDDAFTQVVSVENKYKELEHFLDTITRTYEPFRATPFQKEFLETFIEVPYLILPDDDIHYPIKDKPNYKNILSILISVTKDTNIDDVIFNLGELPKYEFTEEIKDIIMRYEYEYMTESLNSIFNVTLYDKNQPIRDAIKVTNNLDVILLTKLPLNGIYRVVISVIKNVNYLSYKTKKRIEENYEEYGNLNETLDVLDGLEDPDNLETRFKNVVTIDIPFPTDKVKQRFFYSYIISKLITIK